METDNFQSLPGRGLKAEIDDVVYFVGNPRLFSEIKLMDPEVEPLLYAMQRDGKTVFLLGTENKLLGLVAVADSLRRDTKGTIKQLRRLGISNIIMLTGDNKETAEEISRQIGIDDYRAELLPKDKVLEIENLSKQYGRVAMVGDGINDAPAISRADVGIAMGAVGSGVALETSDIALMGDELKNIPYTIKLSRRALRIIKQNVAVAIAVKVAFISLAVLGISTLWMAVFADTGISILVILNGMRLFSRSMEV
jgi:Cd2+/Zn2+-exporting ATPase